jgi:hypothetical protein
MDIKGSWFNFLSLQKRYSYGDPVPVGKFWLTVSDCILSTEDKSRILIRIRNPVVFDARIRNRYPYQTPTGLEYLFILKTRVFLLFISDSGIIFENISLSVKKCYGS